MTVLINVDKEFKALIPALSQDEFNQLEQNILAEGVRDPLVVWRGKDLLIDGHNRYEIACKHGLEFERVELAFDNRQDAWNWMINNQLGRRNISSEQRDFLFFKRYESEKKGVGAPTGNKNNSSQLAQNEPIDLNAPGETAEKLAQEYNVGRETIKRAVTYGKAVDEIAEASDNPEETRQALLTREISLPKRDAPVFAKIAKESPEKAREILKKGGDEVVKAIHRKKTEERHKKRAEKIVEISQSNKPIPDSEGPFNVIYADPPWRYEHVKTESRAIENQYPTMSLDEICALPVAKVAADDCILFMWATSPKLEESMRVLSAWGFTYRTCAVWDKQKIGMGYYFRQQHELLLVASKGNLPVPLPENRPSSVFSVVRGEHSAKPHEFYKVIEQMYPEYPKAEFFCRSPQEGWFVWGNQSA